MLIERIDDNTVHALNSLDTSMQCSQQTGWHTADETLITTIRDLPWIHQIIKNATVNKGPRIFNKR